MIGVTWTGWDGSVWDLHNGPVYLSGGIDGLLSMLTGTAFTRDTALTDGQYFTGWRADPRAGLMPVLIGQSETESEWLALERAWWRTMRIDRPGVLAVTAPDGTTRRITLRFVDDGGMASPHDPSRYRLTVAPLKMIADDPWWVGDTFTAAFSHATNAGNFYGNGAGFGPPFTLGSRDTTASATVTNPGDVPVWPTYIVTGPVTSFRAAIDGKAVEGTYTLLAGQSIRIETSPARQVAFKVVNGAETNITRELSSVEFAPIPDGASVGLDIQIVGDGGIALHGVPKYYRAW